MTGPFIVKAMPMLAINPDDDPTKVEYYLSVTLVDSTGREHQFKGTHRYPFDQSGLAYTDLEKLQIFFQYDG